MKKGRGIVPTSSEPRPQVAQPTSETAACSSASWILSEELYHAAGRGDVARVKSLLARGADPSSRGEEETPLHETVIYGHAGRVEVSRLLIEAEWQRNGGALTDCNGRWLDDYVDADSEFGTPLGIAVDNDDIRMVTLLLSYDAHPDADGCSGGTPLHRAAKGGNVRILRLLLDQAERQMEEMQ